MIETELKFKSKPDQAEFLRRLSESNINIIPEMTEDEYQWEAIENFYSLARFPEYLEYPAPGSEESYYLRCYWVLVHSKRFEKKFGYDLWQLEGQIIMDEYGALGFEVDDDLLKEIMETAAARVASEPSPYSPVPPADTAG